MWKMSLIAWRQRPWIGVGFGGYQIATAPIEEIVYPGKDIHLFETPHSTYIMILTENGVVGLSLFLCSIAAFFMRAFRIIQVEPIRIGVFGGAVIWFAAAATDTSTAGVMPGNELSLSSVYFDRVSPSTIYVSSVAPQSTATHLWKTTDSGANWTAIDGNGLPTGVPVNLITADPGDANTLYAGTHLGVYRSQDAGATWVRFGAGLPLVNVTDLYISDNSQLLRVATFGRGIWELAP
jgi:hypothetical protein